MSQEKNKIIFFRESTFKVAELIFNRPSETFHLRKLAEEVNISTTAVSRSIEELAQFKIITIEKTDITTNINANIEDPAYRFYKKFFNIYRLERYNLVASLQEIFQAKAIVLFGSFAKGEDTETSDIDICIVSNRKETDESKKYMAKYAKVLHRNISLHILPSLERSSAEFKNALANGIVLDGYLKVV